MPQCVDVTPVAAIPDVLRDFFPEVWRPVLNGTHLGWLIKLDGKCKVTFEGFPENDSAFFGLVIYNIPGTQMTLVLIGKGLVLEG